MSEQIREQTIVDHLIQRLRADEAPILFNGHFGVSESVVRFSGTQPAKDEVEFNAQPWMIERHNEVYAHWMHLLSYAVPGDVAAAWLANKRTGWYSVAKNTCYVCGERVATLYNGEAFTMVDTKKTASFVAGAPVRCRFPGGIGDYSVEIDVPSGRLVFANDLREIIPGGRIDHDVNCMAGVYNTVRDTADKNFLTAYVGNTCPSVFVDGDTITIGTQGYDDDDEVIDPIAGYYAGTVVTDLWWFYAVDETTFDEANMDIDLAAVAACNPGRYKMVVHRRQTEEDYKVACVYATISRLEDDL